MGRKRRFIPEGGSLVEVTTRTVHGRPLLRPSRELNEMVVGVLARARRRHPVRLSGLTFASNHYHLLAWAEEARTLAGFMGYLNGNLAREVGRLHQWPEKVWSRRYQSILVSEEEPAQVARLKYLLSHGAKEGLVARPQDWPGVHCARSLLTGEPLSGFWFDRTRNHRARQRGEKIWRYDFAEEETLTLDKLPCWEHLSDEDYRQRVAGLIAEIEEEAAAMRRQKGIMLPGVRAAIKAIERVDPHARPKTPPKKSPAPTVHAFRRTVRRQLMEALRAFEAAYDEAARRLRAGDRRATFPEGSFPPPLPFVEPRRARAP